jgi:tetratricopeptide (TPR) repeat protein
LEVFPRYLACHEVLGKVCLRQARLADAKRELELVHAVITDNPELNKALIKLYHRLGEHEKAAPLLEEAIQNNPFDFEMRNIRTHLRRQAEMDKLGGDPRGIDIYELAERKSAIVDIRQIIAEDDAYRAISRAAAKRATEHALDNLDNLETSIDAVADVLSKEAMSDEPEGPEVPLTDEQRAALLRKQEMLAEGIEELSVAAVIAQIELEISLLDEATILCRRMLAGAPHDEDLQSLAEKFHRSLQEKETELEKLEGMNLARGL